MNRRCPVHGENNSVAVGRGIIPLIDFHVSFKAHAVQAGNIIIPFRFDTAAGKE